MVLPGRQTGGLGRYGFNGKEQDPEVKGSGAQYDYGFRIYDPRLGKFLSVDPITSSYPMLTPYQFASNRPIDGIDLDGLEHLNSNFSKIDIGLSVYQFNGVTVLSGAVYLDRSKIFPATKSFIDAATIPEGTIGSPRSIIARFQSGDVGAYIQAFGNAFSPETPGPEDVEQNEPAIELQKGSTKQKNPFNKDYNRGRANRAERNTGSAPSVPVGGSGSSRTGNIILALASAGELAGKFILNKAVERDFNAAIQQLSSVKDVLNDIQLGLNTNVFSSSDLPNLSSFANYLLDGKLPESNSNLGTIDYNLLKRFDKLKSKIAETKYTLSAPDNCVPCEQN